MALSVFLPVTQDPLMSTWELNGTKSKRNPPPNLRETLSNEPYSESGVKSAFRRRRCQQTTEYAGYRKDYPVTGNRDEDAIVMADDTFI